MQADGGDGCLWGCGIALALTPIVMIVQALDERKKNEAERLEKENRVLRLKAERKRLTGPRPEAERLAAENRRLRLEAEQARLKTEHEDALAERKRREMEAAGYVLCPACKQWRKELTEKEGVCEPCVIDDEIESLLT